LKKQKALLEITGDWDAPHTMRYVKNLRIAKMFRSDRKMLMLAMHPVQVHLNKESSEAVDIRDLLLDSFVQLEGTIKGGRPPQGAMTDILSRWRSRISTASLDSLLR
jgi:hypothetical protein